MRVVLIWLWFFDLFKQDNVEKLLPATHHFTQSTIVIVRIFRTKIDSRLNNRNDRKQTILVLPLTVFSFIPFFRFLNISTKMRMKQLFVSLPFQMKLTSFIFHSHYLTVSICGDAYLRQIQCCCFLFGVSVWLFDWDMAARHDIKTCVKIYYQFVHKRNVLVREPRRQLKQKCAKTNRIESMVNKFREREWNERN